MLPLRNSRRPYGRHSNSPRRLPRIELRCSARPTGLIHIPSPAWTWQANRAMALRPSPDSASRQPCYQNYLPCRPLWYCLTAAPTGQYQRGLQPDEKQRIVVHDRLRHHGQAPVGRAEHRRLKRGSRRGLFEQQTEGLMRVPQPPFQARSTGNPQRSGGRDLRVAFSLDTFFWRSKRKYLGCGTNSRWKTIARQRTKPDRH